MALKMHRYFKDDENLGAVRAYLDKCRDGMAISHHITLPNQTLLQGGPSPGGLGSVDLDLVCSTILLGH